MKYQTVIEVIQAYLSTIPTKYNYHRVDHELENIVKNYEKQKKE